jgi:hypothetical protein
MQNIVRVSMIYSRAAQIVTHLSPAVQELLDSNRKLTYISEGRHVANNLHSKSVTKGGTR